MKTKLFLTGIALVAFVATGISQSNNDNKKQEPVTTQGTFVDNNNNGTCDNFENRTQGNRQGKGYRKGNCKNNQNGKGYRNGQGKGNCPKRGQGQFVDADKNGVCDNRE